MNSMGRLSGTKSVINTERSTGVYLDGDNPVTDVNDAAQYGMTGALSGTQWQDPTKATCVAETMETLEHILFDEE